MKVPFVYDTGSDLSGHNMDVKVKSSVIVKYYKMALLFTILIFICFYLARSFFSEPTYSVSDANIEYAIVTKRIFEEAMNVNATVTPKNSFVLAAQVPGRIKNILIKNGDSVKVSTPILELLNPSLEVEVSQRESRKEEQNSAIQLLKIRFVEADYAHKKDVLSLKKEVAQLEQDILNKLPLADEGFLPKRTISDLKGRISRQKDILALEIESHAELKALQDAQYKSALNKAVQYDLDLKYAKQRAGQTKVNSEHAGQITNFNRNVGEQLSAGEVIGQIQSFDGTQITGQIDEYYLSRVSLGQNAHVEFQESNIRLKLTYINPRVENGKFSVEWIPLDEFAEGLNDLKIGQTVKVKHYYNIGKQKIVLPMGDFYTSKVGDFVFVQAGDIAIRRPVSFGKKNDNFIEVISGLEVGESVIVSDYSAFNSFDQIKIE